MRASFHDAFRRALVEEMDALVGTTGGVAVRAVAENAAYSRQGRWRPLLGLAAVAIGAIAVFAQLQVALNRFWDREGGDAAREARRADPRYAIGLYLGRMSIGDVYGTAGSFAVLLVWVYYTALVSFFGAEFTQVYARRYGARIRPSEYAEPRDAET